MAVKITVPKGTFDILPDRIPMWEKIEKVARDISKRFGYKEIRTPEFENTNLFVRGVGETTDIVQKEMYTFTRGKESFTLKPEGTAAVVRSYIENGMSSLAQPVKLFYLTNCFRGENPQKGRYRQFHQFGIEAIGSNDPMMDAEIIVLADTFIKELGIKNVRLTINSVGCPTCRGEYYTKLREALKEELPCLCEDCKGRYEKNPMRIIDCKKEHCKELTKDVPMMIDCLCEECLAHFNSVKDYLSSYEIDYEVDPKIVRGLDYYSNTAFEFITDDLGAQSTLCGGGRYNYLVEQIGGNSTAGIGLALGLERLLLILEAQEIDFADEEKTDVYIAPLGEDARKIATKVSLELRKNELIVQTDMMKRSLKAQMKFADKIKSNFVLILGEDEIKNGVGILRNMNTKEQTEIKIDMLAKGVLEIVKTGI